MNKICVYAICKNESQFVDRWVDSMQEADEIVVVDTGSTDDTVEKLKARGCRVEIKTWAPWRFDEPRNYAMSLASEDCNIFISTDLDEVLEPGWADILRAEWIDGKHTRAQYKYAWSHAKNGEPARVFYYDKIHDKNWKWKYPVHELLVRNDKCGYNVEETLNLFDKIYLHHYPDRTKSRGSYLKLLELRVKENPTNDSYGKLYLAHEYYYRRQYYTCTEFITKDLLYDKHLYTNMELANIYLFLGDAYREMGKWESAVAAWISAIQIDKTYREPYLRLAAAANNNKQYYLAIGYVKEALASSIRRYSWLEQDNSWNAEPYDILSISYYYLGDYEKSFANINKALHLSSMDDTRLKQNLDYIQNKFLN